MTRYLLQSLRALRRDPAFTIVVLACLGLGLGASTAIFSVAYSILFRPLPVRSSDRVVRVYDRYRSPQAEEDSYDVSPGNYVEWQAQEGTFSSVGAARLGFASLTDGGEPLQIRVASASASFFDTLGASPVLGRAFTAEEDRPGHGAGVVVLSHGLWRRQLGADPRAIGRTIQLDGVQRVVVGVMPPGFDLPREGASRVDAWVPLGLDPDLLPNRNWHTLRTFARLQSGVSVQQAREVLSAVAERLERDDPKTHRGWGVRLVPLRDDLVGTVRPALARLAGLVGLVLLIASLNVANLQLARSLRRRGEIAVRMSLGGSRRDLVKQLLAESWVVSVLGGLLGLALAWVAIPLLVAASPPELALRGNVTLGLPVLGFALLLSFVTGSFLALAPLSRMVRSGGPVPVQGVETRVSTGLEARRAQRALVVLELALALMLVAGAALLLKSLHRLERVDTGLATQHVLALGINLPQTRYPDPASWHAFQRELLQRVRALPGAEAAGVSLVLPMGLTIKAGLSVEGAPTEDDDVLVANHRLISPGYLEAMGIPLVAGRLFSSTDREDTLPVVIVSREMARRYWPGESPVGKRVKRGGPSSPKPWITVVGVVGDVRDAGLDSPVEPTWYLPISQAPSPSFYLAVRTRGRPLSLAAAVRQAVWSVDRQQAVHDLAPLDRLVALSVAQRRFNAWLFGLFALVGVALALAGIYGVLAYLAAQHRREFGIRMALGARPRDVVRLVFREGLALVGAGILLGCLLAFSLGHLLSALLYGLSGTDATTILEASLVLSAVALTASLVPAFRAGRANVAAVLRD